MREFESDPAVSVVLPIYNASEFILDAVRSILDQSFSDLELIAIDDGSDDDSLHVIKSLARADNRLRLISRENKGLVATLNEGVALARGRYIARMDADDVSLSRRIEKQVEYLDRNPAIDVVGCHYELIDGGGEVKKAVQVPLSTESIFLQLSYTVPFAHPSVLMRRTALTGGPYRDVAVEDYRLWVDLFNGENFANLDATLFRYRHNYGGSFSDTKRLKMIESEKDVRRIFFRRFSKQFQRLVRNPRRVTDKRRFARSVVENFRHVGFSNLWKVFVGSPSICFFVIFYLLRRQARVLYWGLRRG